MHSWLIFDWSQCFSLFYFFISDYLYLAHQNYDLNITLNEMQSKNVSQGACFTEIIEAIKKYNHNPSLQAA